MAPPKPIAIIKPKTITDFLDTFIFFHTLDYGKT